MRPKPPAILAVLAVIPCLPLLFALSPTPTQAQTPAAKVGITFDGKVVTDQVPVKPTVVLVGEPIHLGLTVSGGTVTSHGWLLPWGVINYYNPTPQTEKITTLTDCPKCYLLDSPTIYWIDPGTLKAVTLSYVVNVDGKISTGRTTATFLTQGPMAVAVTAVYNVNTNSGGSSAGKVSLYDVAGQPWVGLGDGTAANEGITFKITKASMPSSAAGQFEWVQLVNSDQIQYFPPSGTVCTENTAPGVDLPTGATGYWYGLGQGPIEDSITQQLGSDKIFNRVNRRFTATMYLRWRAQPDYVPAPIGSVAWYTGWNLTFGKKPDGTNGWMVSWYDAGASPLETSLAYPLWSGPAQPQNLCKW